MDAFLILLLLNEPHSVEPGSTLGSAAEHMSLLGSFSGTVRFHIARSGHSLGNQLLGFGSGLWLVRSISEVMGSSLTLLLYRDNHPFLHQTFGSPALSMGREGGLNLDSAGYRQS